MINAIINILALAPVIAMGIAHFVSAEIAVGFLIVCLLLAVMISFNDDKALYPLRLVPALVAFLPVADIIINSIYSRLNIMIILYSWAILFANFLFRSTHKAK